MKAIILAAGEGTRLRPYTETRPKCLVQLATTPILLHQLNVLHRAAIEDITVVTGYRADQIEALDVKTKYNPDYDKTNMVASLMCAESIFDGGDDVLIAYGDIVFEPSVVNSIVSSSAPFCTTVDTLWRRLWELRFSDPLSDARRRNRESLETRRRRTESAEP